MQLFHNQASPFVRKVVVVLHETGQLETVEFIPSSGSPTDSGTAPIAQNPLGKVPTLLRDDGPALFDSRVICRFLNARGSGTLYPEARLWDVLTLEALADGMMDAAVLMVQEARCRPEEIRSSDWVEGQWAKVERALGVLEARWLSHLSGPLDIGQISVACALGYLDFRHGSRDWRRAHKALSDWEKSFAMRPSMATTMPSV